MKKSKITKQDIKKKYNQMWDLFVAYAREMKDKRIDSLPMYVSLINKGTLPELRRNFVLICSNCHQEELVIRKHKEPSFVCAEQKSAVNKKQNFILQSLEWNKLITNDNPYTWNIKNTLFEYISYDGVYMTRSHVVDYPSAKDLVDLPEHKEMLQQIIDLDYQDLVTRLGNRMNEHVAATIKTAVV